MYFCSSGTKRHRKELFVIAVRTPAGQTFPGNFAIIPSAKKWVFHAIFRLAFLELYGDKVCSMNRLVLTDEEDAEYSVGVYIVLVCPWTDHILARNPLLEVEADLS